MVELHRPGVAQTGGFIPMILVERLNYDDRSPWPRNADGCTKGGAANSQAIGKPPVKADAALRSQPEGKAIQAAHCVVALRLCSQKLHGTQDA